MCFINSKGIDKVLNTQNHNIEIISLLLYLSCTLHGYQRFACFVPMDSICSKVGLDLGHFFLGDLFSHLRVASLGVSSLVLPSWGENILFDEPARDVCFLFQAHSVGLRDANLQSLSILTFVQCTASVCAFLLFSFDDQHLSVSVWDQNPLVPNICSLQMGSKFSQPTIQEGQKWEEPNYLR